MSRYRFLVEVENDELTQDEAKNILLRVISAGQADAEDTPDDFEDEDAEISRATAIAVGDESHDLLDISNVPGAGLYAVCGADGWYAHNEAPEISVGPLPSAQAVLEELFRRKFAHAAANDHHSQ